MNHPHRIAAVLTLVVAATAGACSRGTDPPAAREVAEDTGEQVTIQLLRDRAEVPAFTITDVDGRTLSSADWQGKVVIVNFWATWCGPCRVEIPDLVELQETYRDHLVVVGISEDDGPGAVDLVKKFAAEHKINYVIAMTSPELQKTFPGIVALPTTYTLDREGRLAQKHVGLLNARKTEATTRALAGLQVNATVEEVEDPDRLSAASAAQLKEVPGLDLAGVNDAKRTEVLQALNSEKCSCGCDLSVAKCRVDDPTCPVSLPQAKGILARLNP